MSPRSLRGRAALALAVTAWSCAAEPERPPAPEAERGCLVFVGDVTLARGIGRLLDTTNASPWAQWKAPGRNWVGNYEGSVGDPLVPCPKFGSPCLVSEIGTFERLRGSPFVAMSVANNHAGDGGPEGLAALKSALLNVGIAPVAEDDEARFVRVGGVTWALVSLLLAGRTAAERQRALESARLRIGLARAQTPWVVVLPHWGEEYSSAPSPGQVELAALFVRWGASVVAGAHPHVLQGEACGERSAVYFSLGNHLFDQHVGETGTGGWVKCCPGGDGLRCTSHRTTRAPRELAPVPSTEAPTTCAIRTDGVDTRWLQHPGRAEFSFVQPYASLGDGHFFALRRLYSDFDHEVGLRPYVFRVDDGGPADVWRGTALALPIVAARVVPVDGREYLCALHRADPFVTPDPKTLARVRLAYEWNGFGFTGVTTPSVVAACGRDTP